MKKASAGYAANRSGVTASDGGLCGLSLYRMMICTLLNLEKNTSGVIVMSIKVDDIITVGDDRGCKNAGCDSCHFCPFPDCIKARDTRARAVRILLGQGKTEYYIRTLFGISKSALRRSLVDESIQG